MREAACKESTSRPRRGTAGNLLSIALLLVMVALFGIMFHYWGNTYAGLDARQATRSLFVWLSERWSDSALSFGGNYSHGWLVPLVSLWLVWTRRLEIMAAERRISRAGLAVILAALASHWMGARGELPQLSVVAFIGLLWGVPLYFWGWGVARILFFPCVYLLFAVPVGFLDSLTFPLRMFATMVSEGMLNGFGIPVVRVGTALNSTLGQGFSLEVADPCSGIRSLMAMMAVSAAYAYVTQPTTGRKWILFLLAIPLAVVGNIGRILAVGLVAILFGMQSAMGVYHDYSGYVFYAFAIGSMLLVDRLINRRAPALSVQEEGAAVPGGSMGGEKLFLQELVFPSLMVTVLAGLTILMLNFTVDVSRSGSLAISASLPSRVGDWKGEEVRYCQNPECLRDFPLEDLADPGKCPVCEGSLNALAYAELQLLPKDTLLVRKRYRRAGWPPISVAMVFSGGSRSSIHRPEICTVGQGFNTTRSAVIPVPVAGRVPLEVMGIDLEKKSARGGPGTSLFMAYWFEGGKGRETPSHTRRILWMAADRILEGNPVRWAYVSVQMPGSIPPPLTRQRVTEFIGQLHPELRPPSQ
jgi:exosortase